jgi:ankyrin repeat protein
METFEHEINRVLYREPEQFDEFLLLYAELKSKGNIKSRIFLILRDAIYAEHRQAQEFLWNEILNLNLDVRGEEETLLAAAYAGNVWMIRQLISKGMELSQFESPMLDSPLERAASKCQLATVKFLLASYNFSDEDLDDALYSACEAPEQEFVPVEKVSPVVKVLLEAGASPDPDVHPTWSTWEEVTSNDDEETALLLLKHGAEIQTRCGESLSRAAYGMPRVMRELIKRGMRGDDIVRDDNMTFLMEAAWNKDAETVKTLLELGADINAKDDNGMTALDYARQERAEDIVELLTSYQESHK